MSFAHPGQGTPGSRRGRPALTKVKAAIHSFPTGSATGQEIMCLLEPEAVVVTRHVPTGKAYTRIRSRLKYLVRKGEIGLSPDGYYYLRG